MAEAIASRSFPRPRPPRQPPSGVEMDLLRHLLPRRASDWVSWVRKFNPDEADEATLLAAQVVANVLVAAPQSRAEARRYLDHAKKWSYHGRAALLWIADQSFAH